MNLLVSWTYFELLGIRPAIGPGFTELDGRPGSPPAVIVSHGFWQHRLGGRTDVIGQPIRLDGSDHSLAGVLPEACLVPATRASGLQPALVLRNE